MKKRRTRISFITLAFLLSLPVHTWAWSGEVVGITDGDTITVLNSKTLLNEELVKAGLAWVYRKYCHHPICESWKNFQIGARMDKRGLWADPNRIPPWEFRRKRRNWHGQSLK